MTTAANLGPICMGTLITANLDATVRAYVDHMHSRLSDSGTLDAKSAAHLQVPHLAGKRFAVLANSLGRPWLRVIEDVGAMIPAPVSTCGWLSLETLVDDVDNLTESLAGSPFEVLRPSADLELSDAIRASQVRGPAGEILYLTQIKADCPPFELPFATCPVDHTFIPVLASHDRAASLKFYEDLANNSGLQFDTKITVINQVHGFDMDRQHPVATLQLAGQCLIEIDELPFVADASPTPPAGIAMISIAVTNLRGLGVKKMRQTSGPFVGLRTAVLRGPAGEFVELVEEAR